MWRPDQLAVEARRNLGPAHAVLGLLTAVVVGPILAFLLLQGHRALLQEAERRAGGSLVWTATATDPTAPLDGGVCTRLVTLPGVAASGGQSAAPLPALSAYPGGRALPVVGLTPGAVQVFVPSAPWAAVTVGSDLAVLGEVGPGSWLIDAQGARVSAVGTLLVGAPVGALSSSVTVPVLPGAPLAECWVRLEPAAVDHGRDILMSAFPNGTAAVAPFLREQAGAVAPLQQWRRAVGMEPWLVGGALIAATATLLLWTRRTELAVYRAFGTPRSTLLVLVAGELVLVLVPALAAGVLLGSVGFAAAARSGASSALVAVALAQASAAVLVGLAAAVLSAGIVVRGGLTDVLRDR